MSNPNDYTVGWICALMTEYMAAGLCLDDEHDPPDYVSSADNNDYTLGRIGKHNVVIAVLPKGEYGKASAAAVATNMLHTFTNVRIGLMVGIGGGAPMRQDIRLGDVVVSTPGNGRGGVLHYDYGKEIQGQDFQRTGALNQPPHIMLTAVHGLETKYKRQGHQIEESVNAILTKYPRLNREYSRPEPDTDRLFKPDISHDVVCGGASKCKKHVENLVIRQERTEEEDNPMIHYGLIASADQLMKNAITRDQFAEQEQVLCFEMEAAGLMNRFPCLVIRGICDYSDSHKNKDWQGYAALTAALYAKELLKRIPPNRVHTERRLAELVEDVHDTVSRIEANISMVQSRLDQEERVAILNWLTAIDYSAQKNDYISRREKGTSEWILKSSEFQTWLDRPGDILFCPGIPGAGKSIVASTVVDHLLYRYQDDDNVGVAFVFFKFNQPLISRAELLLSLLKHLIRNSTPEPVLDLYRSHTNRKTRPLPDEISKTLHDVTKRFSRTFIIIDALDECKLSDSTSSRIMAELLGLQKIAHANILVTSRYISEITRLFDEQSSGVLEIRAREEDVQKYVEGRLPNLPSWIRETPGLEDKITIAIVRATDGMFLLPEHYLDDIEDQTDEWQVEKILKNLPRGQDALPRIYEQAMRRIQSQPKGHSSLAFQVLSWITQCRRPLRSLELRHALAVKVNSSELNSQCIKNERMLVKVCAGLIEINNQSRTVGLTHYTAQEYFDQFWALWFPDAHHGIATVSLTYLSYNQFSSIAQDWEEYERRLQDNAFYEYAAQYWGHHAREAYSQVKGLTAKFLRCGPTFPSAVQALHVLERQVPSGISQRSEGITGLHIAAHFGINDEVVDFLRDTVKRHATDISGQTALHWAVRNRQRQTVELLLDNGLDVNASDAEMKTALHYAVSQDDIPVIKLPIKRGAKIEARDRDGQTTPLVGAEHFRMEATKELLSQGATINASNAMNQNALHLATLSSGRESSAVLVARLPLSHGIDLSLIGHNTMVEYLLSKGANPNARCHAGDTPLHVALRCGVLETRREFQQQRSFGGLPDNDGWTDNRWRVELVADYITDDDDDDDTKKAYQLIETQRLAVVNSLIACTSIDVNIQNITLDSPLHILRYDCFDAVGIVRKLLELGGNITARNNKGQTPLHLACKGGASAIASSFLDRGCCIRAADLDGLNALHYAIRTDQYDTIKMILERDQEISQVLCQEVDAQGRTLLHHHLDESSCSLEMIKIFLCHGTRLNDIDRDGNSPLSLYLEGLKWADRTDICRFLLQHGADALWQGQNGQNLAHVAMCSPTTQLGALDVLKDHGVNMAAKDHNGKGILHYGAIHGSLNKEFLSFMQRNNILHLHDRDKAGNTPFMYLLEQANQQRPDDTFARDRWKSGLEQLRDFAETDLAQGNGKGCQD